MHADFIDQDESNGHQHPHLGVIYNGIEKRVNFAEADLISTILQRAILAFGITQNQHTLSLYTTSGVELNDNQTATTAGVDDKDTLLLRPSTVKGGFQ